MVTHLFNTLLKITNVNICHKVAHEYHEGIEEMWWLIAMNILDTDGLYEDGVVDYDGAALDEEYVYYSGTAGEITNMYE